MIRLAYLLLLLAVAGAGVKYGEYRSAASHAEALHQAMLDNLAKQKVLVTAVQKIAEDADAEQLDLVQRVAAADDAVERLRETVRSANAGDDPSAPASLDASTARTLLADCAGKYRDMAEIADQLRARVIGLQAYAKEVSR